MDRNTIKTESPLKGQRRMDSATCVLKKATMLGSIQIGKTNRNIKAHRAVARWSLQVREQVTGKVTQRLNDPVFVFPS